VGSSGSRATAVAGGDGREWGKERGEGSDERCAPPVSATSSGVKGETLEIS
jgi:hypothetical protein